MKELRWKHIGKLIQKDTQKDAEDLNPCLLIMIHIVIFPFIKYLMSNSTMPATVLNTGKQTLILRRLLWTIGSFLNPLPSKYQNQPTDSLNYLIHFSLYFSFLTSSHKVSPPLK